MSAQHSSTQRARCPIGTQLPGACAVSAFTTVMCVFVFFVFVLRLIYGFILSLATSFAVHIINKTLIHE